MKMLKEALFTWAITFSLPICAFTVYMYFNDSKGLNFPVASSLFVFALIVAAARLLFFIKNLSRKITFPINFLICSGGFFAAMFITRAPSEWKSSTLFVGYFIFAFIYIVYASVISIVRHVREKKLEENQDYKNIL